MNKGWRPAEIAEAIDLPPGLASAGRCAAITARSVTRERSTSAISPGTDANPATPSAAARTDGGANSSTTWGAAAVIARARTDFTKGEFRWVAQVMKEVVYAEPANVEAARSARRARADGLTRPSRPLAQRLPVRRQELRHGVFQLPARNRHGRRHLGRVTSDMSSTCWRSARSGQRLPAIHSGQLAFHRP